MGVSQTLNAKGFVYLHTYAAVVSYGIHKKPAKCQLIFTYIYIYSVYIHKLSKPPKCMAKLTILEFSMFTVIQTNMTDSVGPLVSQVVDHQAHHGHSRGPS